MQLSEDKAYLLTIRNSLRKTIKTHKSALARIKKSKSRKRLDAEKMLNHSRELEACGAALEKTVNAIDDLKTSELK